MFRMASALAVLLGLVVTPQASAAALVEVTNFGPNPSNLRMHVYRPDRVAARPGILPAPHYCTECANGQVLRTPRQWGDIARSAYPGYTGERPRMQLWHGTADDVLRYQNLGEEIDQWTDFHGLSTSDKVEAYSLQNVGHDLMASGTALRAVQFFGLDRG